MSVNSCSGAHASPAVKECTGVGANLPGSSTQQRMQNSVKDGEEAGSGSTHQRHLRGLAVGLLSSRLARLCSETDRNKHSRWVLTKILFVKLLIQSFSSHSQCLSTPLLRWFREWTEDRNITIPPKAITLNRHGCPCGLQLESHGNALARWQESQVVTGSRGRTLSVSTS